MFREGLRPPNPFSEHDPLDAQTQDGVSLRVMSKMTPVLVVCLGSRVSKTMLREVAEHRRALEETSMRIALVHAQEDPHALFKPHGLEYVARVADPEYAVHRALGLAEKRSLLGGTRQLAGVFVLKDGEVAATLGDAPDYAAIGS